MYKVCGRTVEKTNITVTLPKPTVGLPKMGSDTPRLAPLMNVLFWGRCDFPISFSGRVYVKERLRSSLRKSYGRYGDLNKQCEVPFFRMLHGILDDNNIQWNPPLVRHYTNLWPCYLSGPYYRIWLFTYLREVSIGHLQRVRYANRGRLPLSDIPRNFCFASHYMYPFSYYLTNIFEKMPLIVALLMH